VAKSRGGGTKGIESTPDRRYWKKNGELSEVSPMRKGAKKARVANKIPAISADLEGKKTKQFASREAKRKDI